MTDEWGGVDEKIQDLVSTLNALGALTTSSCEGHIDHGSPAPWVKVTTHNEAQDKEIFQKTSELLDEFYKNREVPADVRLVTEGANAGFWLHNGGGVWSRWRKEVNERVEKIKRGEKTNEAIDQKELGARAEKLPVYQKEVVAFVEFLKKKLPAKVQKFS